MSYRSNYRQHRQRGRGVQPNGIWERTMNVFSDIFSEQIHENRAPRRMDFKTVIIICAAIATGAGITGYAIGQSNNPQL